MLAIRRYRPGVLTLLWLATGLSIALSFAPRPLIGLLGRGGNYDFAQDYAGARALLSHGDPYSILSAGHYSTHPPLAFLFALLVVWLPWPAAIALWMWAMLACELATLRLFGWSWSEVALIVPFLLLWPPASWSLGQLTAIWLLGVALAWRGRSHPVTAGIAVAFAALPKLFGAITLGVFVMRRRWHALVSFGAVVTCALMLLAALEPGAVVRYVTINAMESPRQMARVDNGALLLCCWRSAGMRGLAVAAIPMLLALARAITATDDTTAWACWTWLSIALLPIAWTYSLLPLLPWLLRLVLKGRGLARLLAVVALLSPFISPIPGAAVPPVGVVLCLWFAGLAFACGSGPHMHTQSALKGHQSSARSAVADAKSRYCQ